MSRKLTKSLGEEKKCPSNFQQLQITTHIKFFSKPQTRSFVCRCWRMVAYPSGWVTEAPVWLLGSSLLQSLLCYVWQSWSTLSPCHCQHTSRLPAASITRSYLHTKDRVWGSLKNFMCCDLHHWHPLNRLNSKGGLLCKSRGDYSLMRIYLPCQSCWKFDGHFFFFTFKDFCQLSGHFTLLHLFYIFIFGRFFCLHWEGILSHMIAQLVCLFTLTIWIIFFTPYLDVHSIRLDILTYFLQKRTQELQCFFPTISKLKTKYIKDWKLWHTSKVCFSEKKNHNIIQVYLIKLV